MWHAYENKNNPQENPHVVNRCTQLYISLCKFICIFSLPYKCTNSAHATHKISEIYINVSKATRMYIRMYVRIYLGMCLWTYVYKNVQLHRHCSSVACIVNKRTVFFFFFCFHCRWWKYCIFLLLVLLFLYSSRLFLFVFNILFLLVVVLLLLLYF